MANENRRRQPKDIKNEAHKGHVKAERGDSDKLNPKQPSRSTSDPRQSKRKEFRPDDDINAGEADNVSDGTERLSPGESMHERNKATEGQRQGRGGKDRNDLL